jgi:hypothetical protein
MSGTPTDDSNAQARDPGVENALVAPTQTATTTATTSNTENNNNNNNGGGVQWQWGDMLRMVLMQLAIFYLIRHVMSGGVGLTGGDSVQSPEGRAAQRGEAGSRPGVYRNAFSEGDVFTLAVFLETSPAVDDATVHSLTNSSDALLWRLDGLRYGDWEAGPNKDGTFAQDTLVSTPQAMLTDAPQSSAEPDMGLYLHMYAVKEGCIVGGHDPHCWVKGVSRIDRPLPAPKTSKARRLLGGSAEDGDSDTSEKSLQGDAAADVAAGTAQPLISWWHENVTVALMTDHTSLALSSLPQVSRDALQFDDDTAHYKPHLDVSLFWDRQEHMYPINATTPQLPLRLEYRPLSLLRWQLYRQMEEQWRTQRDWGTQSAADHDEFKRMLLETNPYFLGLTMIVSLLHTVLDLFAFKNGECGDRKWGGTAWF